MFIMVIQENLFTKNECAEIINYAESLNDWQQLVQKKGEVKFNYFMVEVNDSQIINDRFTTYIQTNLKEYNLSYLTVLIFKYVSGGFLGKHVDLNKDNESQHDGVENINVILNDTYKGGQFYLNETPIIAPVGAVYHYKSDIYHEVKEITEGTRYSLICYIRARNLKTKDNKSLL